MGLQRETAARGTLANYIGVCLMQPLRAKQPILIIPLRQVVFALAFERVIFHTTPSVLSIAGSVIIMSSAIYIAVPRFIFTNVPS